MIILIKYFTFLHLGTFFKASATPHDKGSTLKLSPSIHIYPESAASKLLHNRILGDGQTEEEISLLFTGDTQYHYPCTSANYECKKKSAECYRLHWDRLKSLQKSASGESSEEYKFNQPKNHTFYVSSAQEDEEDVKECLKIESKFSNEVQRKSIFDLNRNMKTKPAALVINGDLTNFGHIEQLELFKNDWLTLRIPVYVGLGNHDYENNVNDCVSNQCAHNMLQWFTQDYAPKMNLALDISTSSLFLKKTVEGSLAYSRTFCSTPTSSVCVHLVQLHNRPDYAASISSLVEWKVRGSFNWLLQDLQAIRNHSWPVLINLHNHNHKVANRLKTTLEQWMNSTENVHILRRVIVLFAHLHEQHTILRKCVSGVTIPFIYVGSVPNNRYSLIKFSQPEHAEIFLLQANANSTVSVIQAVDYFWSPC